MTQNQAVRRPDHEYKLGHTVQKSTHPDQKSGSMPKHETARMGDEGLERVQKSLGKTSVPRFVVLQVVLSQLLKLDFNDREWVLNQLQTLSRKR